jgi:hypothetical protein
MTQVMSAEDRLPLSATRVYPAVGPVPEVMPLEQRAEDENIAVRQCQERSLTAPMDSQHVCEVVAEIAAQVLAEVRAGSWRRPSTLSIGGRAIAASPSRGSRSS